MTLKQSSTLGGKIILIEALPRLPNLRMNLGSTMAGVLERAITVDGFEKPL